MSASSGQSKESWSMGWVAASILVFIVGYTFVTLHFRKANKAYEPYHDLKERAQVHKLLEAGYQRIVIPADQPTEPAAPSAPAATQVLAGGLPAGLRGNLFDAPRLPQGYRHVRAPAEANQLMPYPILFDSTQADNHQQLGGASIYVRDRSIVIVPEYEALDGELLARRRDNLVRLTIPAGSLRPGRYEVTLAGAESSCGWTLQVH